MNQIQTPPLLYANRSLFTSVSASVSLLELEECLPPLVPESGTFHSCSYTTSRGTGGRDTGELSATGRGQFEGTVVHHHVLFASFNTSSGSLAYYFLSSLFTSAVND